MSEELAHREQASVLQQLSEQQRQLTAVAALAMQATPMAQPKGGLPPRSPTAALARSSSAPTWTILENSSYERGGNSTSFMMSPVAGVRPGRSPGGASPGPQMSPTTFSADADF